MTHPQQRARLRLVVTLSALAVVVPLVVFAWHVTNVDVGQASAGQQAIGPAAYPPARRLATLPHQRAYTIERQGQGFALMASDDPATHLLVATLPGGFGSEATDTIAALDLSPNQQWLAIDGMHEHGDHVWIVATTTGTLRELPTDATGNFLHWLPDGDHFLFRPFLPLRASDATWNPGLWIVDAASGTHVNLALPGDQPATDLVDAAPSPDGTHIILSLTTGLGQGSTVYMATPDGLNMHPLFQSAADVAALAWSPNGGQIAYETIEDSTIPFRPAGLWTMAANATGQRQIALTDGGHGFAPTWSADSSRLAFVTRLNADDSQADAVAGQLRSAVAVANVMDGTITTIAAPDQTHQPRNIAPTWQPDGSLAFTAMGASTAPGAAIAPARLWHTAPLGASLAQPHLMPMTAVQAMSVAVLVP